MPKDPGRHGSAYWKARKIVLAGATHCAICWGALDFNAPPRTKWAPSCDHIISLSELKQYHPDERCRLAVDPANMRAVHVSCNASRGARSMRARVVHAPVEPRPQYTGKWMNPHNGSPWSRDWYGNNDLNPNWDGVER